jgi:Trm5-related predicted tRNA methylase
LSYYYSLSNNTLTKISIQTQIHNLTARLRGVLVDYKIFLRVFKEEGNEIIKLANGKQDMNEDAKEEEVMKDLQFRVDHNVYQSLFNHAEEFLRL